MTQTTLFDLMTQDEQDLYKPKETKEWKWTFCDYPQKTNGIKVFSCFACGGGSTMGYKLAGCEVLGCCEIDPKMNEIYVKNHHPKYNYLMDIRDFNKSENLPEELYTLDILDGSPPCTTFSMVGQREKNWGKEKKFREGQIAQTLDDLSFVFIETAKKLQPKVVIMENVEGLLLGNAWDYVQQIYSDFKDAGYSCKHWLLKGETMGVPQTRHRVFFVAIRDDLGIKPETIDMCFNYAPVTYGQIKDGVGDEISHNSQEYKMLSLANHDDKTIADVYKRLGEKERRYSAAICWEDNVLPTIVAKLFHYRGTEKTRISKQDVVHAQTFPEDYDFMDKSHLDYEYICGMSVPPLMIKRIVSRIIKSGAFGTLETEDENDTNKSIA